MHIYKEMEEVEQGQSKNVQFEEKRGTGKCSKLHKNLRLIEIKGLVTYDQYPTLLSFNL